jgi:hypothetical protein
MMSGTRTDQQPFLSLQAITSPKPITGLTRKLKPAAQSGKRLHVGFHSSHKLLPPLDRNDVFGWAHNAPNDVSHIS